MKGGFLGQAIAAVLLAALLVVLFQRSHVDTESHSRNIGALLALEINEAELRLLLEQIYRGGVRNFDPLTALQRRIGSSYRDLSQNKGTLLEPQQLEQARRLQAHFKRRQVAIESYQRHIAAQRLVELYFPHVSKELRWEIQLKPKAGMLEVVTRLHLDLLAYSPGRKGQKAELIARLDQLRLLAGGHEKQTQKLLTAFIKYASTLVNSTTAAHQLLLQLNDQETQRRLASLHQSYLTAFEARQQQALYYKVGLFVLATLMLVYLAWAFFHLQHTSEKLQRSLEDLDFRQFALDQHAIVSMTDVQGRITYANDRFCEISKYTHEQLMGAKHNIVRSQYHDKAFFRALWRTVAQGRVWHGTLCNRDSEGNDYWVETTIVPRIGEDGKPIAYIAIRTDVTQKVEAEQRLGWLARLPEENPAPVLRLDRHADLLYANTAAQQVLADWQDEQGQWRNNLWSQSIARVLETGQIEEVVLRIAEREYQLFMVPVIQESYVNVYAHDVTERREAERMLSYQALHDSLTGLANRYHFEELLDTVIEEARVDIRHSVLLYLDLDQFKVVNDTSGHVAGDELLRQIAVLLEHNVRDSDVLARLGGDEFAVLLRNCPLDKALTIARNLRNSIADFQFAWGDKSFRVGVSIGVVEIDNHAEGRSEILSAADVACYAAKDAGRNRVHLYRLDDDEAKRQKSEMHWASLIPKALSDNRFCLMAQAIVPLQEGGHGHYEILVRMLDDNGKLIPPGAFIPAAERYDLMPSIDHWVIRHVFDVMQSLRGRQVDLQQWRFAINLSGPSLSNKELIAYIGERIDSLALPRGLISFEVTETAAVTNLSDAVSFIEALRKLGCRFALDDFGSGLSSFAYLKNLPVDYLKIDGAFVKDLLDDPIDAAMVESINQIGHVMNIKTIAEFVENDDIKQRLTELGVDFAQGYGIHKPQMLDEVIAQHLQQAI